MKRHEPEGAGPHTAYGSILQPGRQIKVHWDGDLQSGDRQLPCEPIPAGVLSTIRHFFDIDESQARDPSARVRLSKVAGLM